MRALALLPFAALALAGCEFIVDPAHDSGTSSHTTASNAGTTVSLGSGASGASTSGAASTSGGSGATGTGASTTSAAATTSAGSTGHDSASATATTGQTLTSTTSVGTTGVVSGATTSTLGTGVGGISSGSTGTIGPGSTSTSSGSSGATSVGPATGGTGGTTGGTTGGVTGGTTGSTTGACGSVFGTTGSQIGPGCVVAHALSTGGSGSTGTTHSGAPPSDWIQNAVPDSHSPCGVMACTGEGDDDDWMFPAEQLCFGEQLTLSASTGPQPVNFVRSNSSQILWQSEATHGLSFHPGAASYCDDGNWSGQSGSMSLPTPSALLEVMDFGAGNGVSPAFADTTAAPYWADSLDGTAFVFDFATGGFHLSGSSGFAEQARSRCVDYATGQSLPPTTFSCTPSSLGIVCLAESGPSATTGLYVLFPALAPTTDFASALNFCNQLGSCGWRLPSYKELGSLVNFTHSPTNSPDVDGMAGLYWSSTWDPVTGTSVMAIDFAQPGAFGPSSQGRAADPGSELAQVICVQ